MAAYCSIVIVILAVSAAQAHHEHSAHNHLPLAVKENDLNIVKELNTKFDDIKYIIPTLKSIHHSQYGQGFNVLRSLAYNIVNLSNRFKYYELLVYIFIEDDSLDAYKIIELIKDIKLILSDENVSETTKGSAVILLSYLTDKLQSIGVENLVELFNLYKKGIRIPCNTSDIFDGLYAFDRELSKNVFYKFVNVSYKDLESEQNHLLSFVKGNCNLDVKIVGLLKLAGNANLKSEINKNFSFSLLRSVDTIRATKEFLNSSYTIKHNLNQVTLLLLPPGLRGLLSNSAIRIRNVRTQRYLTIDEANGQEILASTKDKGKSSRWKWNITMPSLESGYGYICKWSYDACSKTFNEQPNVSVDPPSQVVLVNGAVTDLVIDSDGDYSIIQVKRGDSTFKLAIIEDADDPNNPRVALIDKNSKEYATKNSNWEFLPSY